MGLNSVLFWITYTMFQLFIIVINFFLSLVNLYHSPGNLRVEKKRNGFYFISLGVSGLCLVTKKIKDYSSKGMFAKSTTLKKRLDQKRQKKSMEYKTRNFNSTLEMLVFFFPFLTLKYTILAFFQVGPPLT